MRNTSVLLLAFLGTACRKEPALKPVDGPRQRVEICDNGKDDDGDGAVDCDDPTCHGTEACAGCGDGILQAREECDPPDFGGVSCSSLGFGQGILLCTADCSLDTSLCLPPAESCETPGDEDVDGLPDCDDPECVRAAACQQLVIEQAPPERGMVSALLQPLQLRLLDAAGEGIAGADVTVETSPGATSVPRRAKTGADGRVSIALRLGRLSGSHEFHILVRKGPSLDLEVEAQEPPPGTIHAVLNPDRLEGNDERGPALGAHTGSPLDLAVASDGTIYVAESCRVIAISPAGDISPLLGNGACGEAGATLEPYDPLSLGGIALDEPAAALYVALAGPGEGRVFRLDLATGTTERIAGGGVDLNFTEGSSATEARLQTLGRPRIAGVQLYVPDLDAQRVLRIDLEDGSLYTAIEVPADASAACTTGPAMLAVGDVIADPEGRAFPAGAVCGGASGNPDALELPTPDVPGLLRLDAAGPAHVAGRRKGRPPDGAPDFAAQLEAPLAGAFDRAGNLLLLSGHELLRIDAASQEVTHLAGVDEGFSGELSRVETARFLRPAALAFGPGGDLYVADSGNRMVRRIVAIGRDAKQGLSLEQEVDEPTIYLAQKLPDPDTGATVRLRLRDAGGQPLEDRPLVIDAPRDHVRLLGPDVTDAAGGLEVPLRGGLLAGDPMLEVRLQQLDGTYAGPWPAHLHVTEPPAGTIFGIVGQEWRDDVPRDPMWGPTSRFVASHLASLDDSGWMLLASGCRVYRMDRGGDLEPIAGTGECGFSGDGGPALEARIYPGGIAFEPSAGTLYISPNGTFNGRRPLRVVDLHTKTIEYVTEMSGPIQARDGALYFVNEGLHRFDPGTLEDSLLFEIPSMPCEGRPAGSFNSVFGPPVFTSAGVVLGFSVCTASGPEPLGLLLRRDDGSTATIVQGSSDGVAGEDAPAGNVRMGYLMAFTVDPMGRPVYLDLDRLARVRVVEDGRVRTIAGSEDATGTYDYVPATESWVGPRRLTYDREGHLWLAGGEATQVVW